MFADDNFKFDENGSKLSKQVENTVGKGEIARYEQCLLFSQCLQKACFPGASKGVIVWKWVNKIHTFTKCVIYQKYLTRMGELTNLSFGKTIINSHKQVSCF